MDFVKRQNEIIEEMMNGAELVSRPRPFRRLPSRLVPGRWQE